MSDPPPPDDQAARRGDANANANANADAGAAAAGDDAQRFAVLAALPVAVGFVRDGRFAFVNPAFAEVAGHSAEALLGRDAFSILAPEDVPLVTGRHDARRRGETVPLEYEVTVVRADGARARVEIEPRVLSPRESIIVARPLAGRIRDAALLASLAELHAGILRERTVAGVLDAAVRGLAALGLQAAVARIEGEECALVASAFDAPSLAALDRLGLGPALRMRLEAVPLVRGVAATGRTVFVDDFASVVARFMARHGGSPDAIEAFVAWVRRFKLAIAPLRLRAGTYGVLFAAGELLHSNDAAAVALFASQVASMVEVAQSIEALEQQNAVLATIHRVARLGSEATAEALVPKLLPILAEATGSDSAAMYLAEPERGVLRLVGTTQPGPLADKYATIPLVVTTATGGAAASQQARALSVEEWPEVSREDVRAAGFLEIAIVPLTANGRLGGTLNLARKSRRRYTEDELRRAEMFVAQAALQVERTRLFEDLQRSYQELTRAQQELIDRERLAALGELSAVVAHEVRNPLGVIFNSLATLSRVGPQGEDARMLLAVVKEEAERLNRMVSDLLDFARPIEARVQPEALEGVLAGALEAAARALPSPHVTVDLRIPRDLPPVPVDAHMLRQAIVNLVLNAIQAMPRGGHVVVSAAQDARGDGAPVVRIDVRDDGPGIADEVAGRVFEPFFTTRAAGTGLGLAVVKRIADAHRAEVSVRTAPGRGTTFTLLLPLA